MLGASTTQTTNHRHARARARALARRGARGGGALSLLFFLVFGLFLIGFGAFFVRSLTRARRPACLQPAMGLRSGRRRHGGGWVPMGPPHTRLAPNHTQTLRVCCPVEQ